MADSGVGMAVGWGCTACGGENPAGFRFCGHCGVAAAGERAQHDEHRLVTALFADISGFTTLADRLDAEGLHEIISPVISLLAGVAERLGGTIAKFAGDALLVFFGAPVAQEDHAVRALAVAQNMHRELAAGLDRLPPEAQGLELHIGVNSGRVVAGMFGGDIRNDYSILGDAVNMAQRLESVAPSGETYVGETTARLAGDRFELEFVGELTLKGKPLPVPAWRIVGERALEAGAGPGHRGETPFVGRDAEMAALERILSGLAGGRGGGVGVVGEPGVGKSRLTSEARAMAERHGARWLEARCISYGGSVAYWPYVDLLRRSAGIRIEQDPTDAAAQLARAMGDLGVPGAAPFVGRLLGLPPAPGADDLGDLEPEAFRRGLHRAVAEWLDAVAAVQPVVLAIEDLHWIDRASLDLTADLASRCVEGPVVLYVTARREGRDETAATVAVVAPERRLSLELEPLGPDQAAELVEALLGGPPPAGLVEAVAERAAGNPFFVQEMVWSLQDSGAVFRGDDGAWRLAAGWAVGSVPDTIEGVLSARIDRLSRSAATVLQYASVLGRTVNRALLAAVAEDEVADLEGEIGALVDGGFLDRRVVDGGESLVFHHALVVDVAYERLLRPQRRALHRRVAEAGEDLYGTGDDVVDLLARHLYLAAAGVKAVDYLERAGRRAGRLFANDEAILHLQRAVELARTRERVAARVPQLLLGLADLEDLTGDYDEASRLFEEVRSTAGGVESWRGLASIARRRGDVEGALRLVDEAMRDESLAGADLSPLWLERAWALISEGRFVEAIETAEAALLATTTPEAPVAGHLLLQQSRAEGFLGIYDDALVHGGRALEIFEAAGDLRGVTIALRVLGGTNENAGNYDEAAAVLQRGLELAARTGSVDEVIGCLINLGQLEFRRHNLDEGIAHSRRALEEAQRIGHQIAEGIASVNLGEMLLLRGDLDEAAEACAHGLERATANGTTWTAADAERLIASIRAQQGRFAEAIERAERAAALFVETADSSSAVAALEVAAGAAEQSGDADRARSLRDRARGLATV